MTKLPDHLGGHGNQTHLDDKLLSYLLRRYKIQTMLDIGCGPGGMVELALNKGIKAIGIDGDHTIKRTVPCIIHDFVGGPYKPKDTFDLAWSVEFLEHIPEEYIPHFMPCFEACKRVVMTFSANVRPRRHYNPQKLPYWIKVFEEHGFAYSEKISNRLRNRSSMRRNFFRDTGSYFFNLKFV